MRARQEREQAQEIQERFAPVGTPADMAKSHATNFYNTHGSSSSMNSKGKMMRMSTLSNPNHMNFPKYYEFQDDQPLYPYPLEDAQRAESQANHAIQSKLMARNALIDQINYNKLKKEAEKKVEQDMGMAMIQNAQESLYGEHSFKQM